MHTSLKLIRVTEQHAINKITVRNVRLTTRDLSVVRSRPKMKRPTSVEEVCREHAMGLTLLC